MQTEMMVPHEMEDDVADDMVAVAKALVGRWGPQASS
jgi:hypothetical protein